MTISEIETEPGPTAVPQRNGMDNLRRFPKGQSGNPSGRGGYKRTDFERLLHKRLTKQGRGSAEDVVNAIVDCACDPDHKHFMDAQRMLWDRLMPVQAKTDGRALPTIVLEVSPGMAASISAHQSVTSEPVSSMPTLTVQSARVMTGDELAASDAQEANDTSEEQDASVHTDTDEEC